MELTETERVIVNALHLEGKGLEEIAVIVKRWRLDHNDLGVYYLVAQELIAYQEPQEKGCLGCALCKPSEKEDNCELLEDLAELEHEQWVQWSKSIAASVNLSDERQGRWETFWCPYNELSEEMKDEDRKWARKALGIIRHTK